MTSEMRLVYVHWKPGRQMQFRREVLPAAELVFAGQRLMEVGVGQ
jgi:hypothetical protein